MISMCAARLLGIDLDEVRRRLLAAFGAVTTMEQFPSIGRLSGLALGPSSTTAIFGGFAPSVAQGVMYRTGWLMVPGAITRRPGKPRLK